MKTISQDRGSQTDRSILTSFGFHDLKLKDFLKFISSLLMPLALGVFTVIITLQQHQLSKQQREEDQLAAERLRQQERVLSNERYQNEVLDSYIREIGELLERNKGSLTRSQATATLARAKTLNTFRQLDPYRSVRILRFLYEAGQLTQSRKSSSLDLSTAELRNIDFSYSTINKRQVEQLSLAGAILSHATFVGVKMKNVNFSEAQLDHATFAWTQVNNVDYSFCQLDHTNFYAARLKNVDFSNSTLQNANFSSVSFMIATLSGTIMENVDFSNAQLERIDFSYSTIFNTNFINLQSDDVEFSFTILNHTNFYGTTSVGANIVGAVAFHVNFQNSSCVAVNFSNAKLFHVTFSGSNMRRASFHNAELINVSFFCANLYKADFSSTQVTETQLQQAFSIQDALLPNGTYGQDKNMISNTYVNCNITLGNGWPSLHDYNTHIVFNNYTNNCQFISRSHNTTSIVMFRRIDLSNYWNANKWSYSRAVVRAHTSPGVHIGLSGISDRDTLDSRKTGGLAEKSISLILHKDMVALEVFIEFTSVDNQTPRSYWCNDTKVFIVYDASGEFQQVIPYIPLNAKWEQDGDLIAGKREDIGPTTQIWYPRGLFIDDEGKILIASMANDRIVEWKIGDTDGRLVAGGYQDGNGLDQLLQPEDVLVDKATNSLIICDRGNYRVVRWSRRYGTHRGEILLENINCGGLAMDDDRHLYVSNLNLHEVRRYRLGEENGTIVAGGHGQGVGLNQFSSPSRIFVDQLQNLYITDRDNNRVMKWCKHATQGIVVAGGHGDGHDLNQLSDPGGIVVDSLGTLYVADRYNHRVMSWPQGSQHGAVVVDRKHLELKLTYFSFPDGLCLDRYGHLYLTTFGTSQVFRFRYK